MTTRTARGARPLLGVVAVLLLALAPAVPARGNAAEPEVTARVVLRWKPVSTAVAYELEIARDAQFTNVVLRERTQVPGYRWRALPTDTFYWRVRSIDAAGRPGDWSEPSAISPAVGAPVLLRPANGAVITPTGPSLTVDVAVQPSELIREYTVELARDARFGGEVLRARSATSRLTVPLEQGGSWYWRVRGVDLEGRETGWSEVRNVRIEAVPPTPLPTGTIAPWASPAGPVELRWTATADGPYEVEVVGPTQRARTFEAPAKSVAFAPDGPGTFTWRVRVAGGMPSAWTAPQPFTVPLAPPELTRPLAGAELGSRREVLDVTLEWKLPPGATRALVEVARDPEFTSLAGAEHRDEPAWVARGLGFGTYFWRVTAEAPERAATSLSGAATFRVVALPPLVAPVLRTPADRTVVARAGAAPAVTLGWDALEEAVSYEVEVAPTTAPEQLTRQRVTVPAATIPGLGEGDHLWRVRALDADGNTGAWSEHLRFFFGRPPTARAEIIPSVPQLVADGSAAAIIAIQLRDGEGRAVTGGEIEVSASTGLISEVKADGAIYRARYQAPASVPDGEVAWIIVRDRTFEATTRLRLVPPAGRVRLAALAGWTTTFGAINSPTLALGVSVRLPVLRERALAIARGAYYASTIRPGVDGGPLLAETRVGRLVLAAGYEQAIRGNVVYGGAGIAGQLVSVRAGELRTEALLPGLHLLLGGWRALGPGHVLVEASYTFGGLDDTDIRVRTGGLTLTAGYQVPLF